jgi:signal transduction histidine kinase
VIIRFRKRGRSSKRKKLRRRCLLDAPHFAGVTSCGRRTLMDGGVLVEVRDSGPGIDSKNPERVFEPFYTTKTGGVGMGLSICRSIINGHGGRLWAEANDRHGAVFQFILPSADYGSDFCRAGGGARGLA